jgi:hypothetical protein
VVNDECMCIDKECAVMTGKKGYKVLVISA